MIGNTERQSTQMTFADRAVVNISRCIQCGLIDCEYSHPKDEVCPDGFMGKKDRKDAAKAEELRREGLTE